MLTLDQRRLSTQSGRSALRKPDGPPLESKIGAASNCIDVPPPLFKGLLARPKLRLASSFGKGHDRLGRWRRQAERRAESQPRSRGSVERVI
jgi:hypothetical protein